MKRNSSNFYINLMTQTEKETLNIYIRKCKDVQIPSPAPLGIRRAFTNTMPRIG